jgi:flavin-dependent thymidylate synthase
MTSKILEVNFEDPIVSLATIANTCYSTLSLDDNKEKFTHNREKAKKLVKNLIKSGHHSVLEHVTLTIEFTGSRAFTHQLIRHRLASYTQRSQRYCDEKNFNNYIPQSVQKNEKALEIFNSLLSNIESVYTDLQKLGISREKKNYNEYYFPYQNSYIVYEIQTETGKYCVLSFKSQGRVAFRFFDSEYDKRFFIDKEGKAFETWDKTREVLGKIDSTRIVSNYEEYRNILYGNNKR